EQKGAPRRSRQAGVALREQLVAADPENLNLQHDRAISYNNLSFVERELDWARAEESCRHAIGLLEKLVTERKDVASYRGDLARGPNNIGAILAHRGDWDAACKSYRAAIDQQEQLQRLA